MNDRLMNVRLDEEYAQWLRKYADHEPGWADACLAVRCATASAARVGTYGGEFAATWRRPDARANPLAG